ncbi:unnamed protein product, partial [Sphacelaria rigidula]
ARHHSQIPRQSLLWAEKGSCCVAIYFTSVDQQQCACRLVFSKNMPAPTKRLCGRKRTHGVQLEEAALEGVRTRSRARSVAQVKSTATVSNGSANGTTDSSS